MTTTNTIPGFVANQACCACGKPFEDIIEYQFRPQWAQQGGLYVLIYIIVMAILNTLEIAYFYFDQLSLESDLIEFWPYKISDR